MIVTVTPNPSIDRTLRVPVLVRGSVHRATDTTAEAGGKGVNVARALATEGHEALAIAPMSAASVVAFRSLLGSAATLETVPIGGDVRVNVGLIEADGTVTKVNEPGPWLGEPETEALLARAAAVAARASWVVGCGSLPPGMLPNFYVRLSRMAPSGVRVAVDADGEALRACRGEPLALIKPNLRELEVLAGRGLTSLGEAVAAAGALVGAGVGAVLVSLGPDGAVYVDRDGATHAEAVVDGVVNPVGAGDALLAGFLAAGGRREGLGLAVAWSIAACRSPGTQMRSVGPADLEAVTVHDVVDSERRLIP